MSGLNFDLKNWWANTDKRQWFILIIIFLLAFGIRGHLMKYPLMFEFDTYWNARFVGTLIQTGQIPALDPMAYYQIGGSPLGDIPYVLWYLTAALYHIFFFWEAFNKAHLIVLVKFLPAIFGALISVSIYFLIKKMYSQKAGYIAAFFAAVVPAFVYRTMAGFFEDDSLGFLWLIWGFYFLVKAVKEPKLDKSHLINGLISGIFFGIMAWTWGFYLIVPLVLISYPILTVILMLFNRTGKARIKSFAALIAIIFIIFAGIATLKDQGEWANTMTGYVAQYLPVTQENIERLNSKGEGVLNQTIGEENSGLQFFGQKYNALIIFPFIALIILAIKFILLPILGRFSKTAEKFSEKDDNISLMIFFWVLISVFMAWNKLKFTYVLGIPIAISAGFVFHQLFYYFKNRKTEKMVIAVFLGFMCLIGAGAASLFVYQQIPTIEQAGDGWKEALYWMKDNTPTDSKMFNWWDEGHWISFIGERKVSTDNRNYDFQADQNFAQFLLTENEADAFKIVKAYNADYVIVSSDLLRKLGAMGMYAYNTTDTGDPRLTKFFGTEFFCSREENPLTKEVKFVCGPNTFSEVQMNSIPVTWISTPTGLIDNQTPVFIYREPDNSKIYMVNAATNNSTAGHLWFLDINIKLFSNVYSNMGVKIFKVNYELGNQIKEETETPAEPETPETPETDLNTSTDLNNLDSNS